MILNLTQLLATTTNTNTQAQGSTGAMLLTTVLPIVLLVVFGYLMIFRPQKKKEKEAAQLRSNLQVGDEILTIGGIVGIVIRKSEDTVVIETGGDRSKLRVKMWAIQENMTVHEETEAAKKSKSAEKTKKAKSSKEDDFSEE